MLSGKEADYKNYDPIKIQHWVGNYIKDHSQFYVPDLGDDTEILNMFSSAKKELSLEEKNYVLQILDPYCNSVDSRVNQFDAASKSFTTEYINGFAKPLDTFRSFYNEARNNRLLSSQDLSEIFSLVSPYFLKEAYGTVNLSDIDKEKIVSGAEFVESGRLKEFLDSSAREKILEIVLNKIPATHCMNSQKPFKLVNNGLHEFQNLSEKYSLAIPSYADYETLGRHRPMFSDGIRSSVHCSPCPVPSHFDGDWTRPAKMVVASMLDLYKCNRENSELRSLNGVDIQFVVSETGLKIPSGSTIYLFGSDQTLTNRQQALADKIGLNVIQINLNNYSEEEIQHGKPRQDAYENSVGKDVANNIRRAIPDSKWGWDSTFGSDLAFLTGVSTASHTSSQPEKFDEFANKILEGGDIVNQELGAYLMASPIQLEWLNKVINHVDRLKS